MKRIKSFKLFENDESDQTKPKITPGLLEDVKDIFFNCFSEEFDSYKFEWWSNDLKELDEDVFYIEISSGKNRIDFIVNSVYDNDLFVDSKDENEETNPEDHEKFERFKKILKDEYDLEFSDDIDYANAALYPSYQEFVYKTYTIL